MSKFTIFIIVIVVGFFGFAVFRKSSQPKEAIIGVQHPEQARNHIPRGQKHDPYNSDPASSGPHYADSGAPTSWGTYVEEVPDEVFLHNEEHGGMVVTYNPQLLPADQLKKLRALFAAPSSNKDFSPGKFILTPRSKDTHAIELASWRWTMNLDGYDEATLMKFFRQHVGQSPEPAAGPSVNQIINQAAGQ